MANDTILAKSNGTSLAQHTKDVLQAIEILQNKQQESYPKEWWVALQYAALLHDLGKIDPVFQAMLKGEKIESSQEIPHGLLSLFFINPAALFFSENQSQIAKAVLSAVAFHHWRESFPDLMMGYRASEIKEKAENVLSSRGQWEKYAKRLFCELRCLIWRYHLNPEVIGINTVLVEYLCYNNLGSAGLLIPPYTLVFLPEQISRSVRQDDWEKLRLFIAGNLMRADHFASLVEDDRNSCTIKDIEWGQPLSFDEFDRTLAKRFGKNYWQKNFFEQKRELRCENLVLIAPTGFGKTEFAYLWGAGKKNIFALPMQAAVNKIWERMRKLMANNNLQESVALLHGNAALELYTHSKEKGQLETEGEQRKALDMARHLAKPYLIATADQVAPTALRYPGYERILSTLMNGALVIDEVQAYDPNAAAIVTHLIQQTALLGGKALLMTATMPPFILREIERRIGLNKNQIIRLIDEKDFEKIASASRHRLRFLDHDGDYDTVVEEIVNAACKNQKVLVVMNTVKAASTIFDRVQEGLQDKKQINTCLLHSRFTQSERKELEQLTVDQYLPNRIDRDENPCIVVATQIVEASLDIDADIIFTEPAPADSLVQRMGRVFRRYARSGSNNAPEDANVVLIIDTSKKKEGDVLLASGIGHVYDRDLTVLSLVMILAAMDGTIILNEDVTEEVNMEFLQNTPWLQCFRARKGSRKKENPNQHLSNLITNYSKSIVLSERQKMNWVSYSYMALEKGSQSDYPLNLGKYMEKYYETLSTLDHGYCSDRRRDAMKLFRNICDITGIPIEMVDDFYKTVKEWFNKRNGKLNYLELATEILPKYTVNCPFNIVRDQALNEVDIDKILDPNTDSRTRNKLERWLSNIYVLDLPYDELKGLIYYEKF